MQITFQLIGKNDAPKKVVISSILIIGAEVVLSAIYLQKIGPLKITDNVNIPQLVPASKKTGISPYQ